MSRLEAQARELGKTTQFSASEAADAMGFLAMAGFDADKIIASMPGTLQLAASAQMDLAQAADIVSNVMTGYNMTAGDLGRVNDVLVKSFTSTNTDLSQLGEAMKYAGPVAAGMGVRFEETAAAVGLMGNAGIQASMAGTALRGALSKLANPARDAQRALGRLGIKKSDLFDQAGNLKSFSNVIRLLGESGASASDMLMIFGDRAGPAMQPLVKQGAEAMANMTASLEQAGGTAKRVADAQMKGAAGEVRKLASAFEGLQLAIAESGLLKWFTDLVVRVTGWVSSLSESNKPLLKWMSIIAIAAAAIAPLLMVLGWLGMAIKGLVVGWAVLKAGMLALSGSFGLVKAGLLALTGPVGLVVAAVMGLIAAAALIYKYWDPIKGFFADLWDDVVERFNAVVDRIRGAVKKMTGWLPSSVRGFFGLDDTANDTKPRSATGSAYAPTGVNRSEVGGEVRIVIDQDGRARVAGVESDSRGFDLNVDAGLVMAGP